MMSLTDAERRVLETLSDGGWERFPHVPSQVLGALYRQGLIRGDDDTTPLKQRNFTITPDGLAAFGGVL